MRHSRVRLGTILVVLAALALFQTPGAVDEAAATPAAGEYTLVRDLKSANFPNMLGLYQIPTAPDEAVAITQDGFLWRVSLSGAFSPVAFGDMSHCPDANDDDGDGRINDGCTASGTAESSCTDAIDNDGDGFVNDGCGAFDPPETCADAIDNEGDGYINDGCPAVGPSEASLDPYNAPYECADAIDNDGDGLINDGCPANTPTERKLLLGAEEGLVGFAFSPDYGNDGRVYLYYTTPENNPPNPARYCCRDRLARFQVTNNALVNSSEVLLLDQHDRYSWHVGGQLAFGPDGYLYVSRGDEGDVGDPSGNAQDTTRLYGKILRLGVTGQSTYVIPPGNPFADGPGGDADEIWAYGFRNPWRFSFDTATGDLWAGDVGQYSWEEVDKVVAGGNYGWDIVEGNHCYESCTPPPGHVPPRAEYCHSQWVSTCPGYNAPGDCAVIGGFVYHGAAMPELEGWYVYGDWCAGKIWALDAASTSSPPVLLYDSPYFLSSFQVLPDGELVVITYGSLSLSTTPGAVYRLVPDDLDDDDDDVFDAAEGQCGGPIDDDANGFVNDGCPAVGAPEITQCIDALNNDPADDSLTNDGCPAIGVAESNQCPDSVDDDGDGPINDGCPAVGTAETDCAAGEGAPLDDDGDGFPNDGCPAVGTPEPAPQCAGVVDNDSDGFINDGCPRGGAASEIDRCNDDTYVVPTGKDDDSDGWINDGCPAVGAPEIVACGANSLDAATGPERIDTPGDDDGDGLANEALPSGTNIYDCDGDGFRGGLEQYVFSAAGTANDQKRCGVDAWPADINNSGFVDTGDLGMLTNDFGDAVPGAAPVRHDLAPDPPLAPPNAFIDTGDIGKITGVFGQACPQ